MSPYVGTNVDKISGDKDKDVVLSLFADAPDGQACEYSD